MLGIATVMYWYWRQPPLNVILVTFDTTRADRLGAYGYKQGLTEGFDDFARRGVVFDRAYAPAPLTLPSHATMLTGLYPPEHGLRVNGAGRLDRHLPLLAEILKARGYDTGAFIAAAVLDSQYGLDRGFDTYDDELPKKKLGNHFGEPRRDGREIMDSALTWLRRRTSRPFFCWIHLYDAHGPYDSRPDVFGQKFAGSPYDAGIAWQIRQFERLTDYLKERRLDANTLVVVAGDHGEGLDDHMESEHGMLVYNTTLLVPLVFVGPRECRPGTRVSTTVSLVDLSPTLLDILRIPAPPHQSGRSLLPALQGKSINARDCYAETHTPFVYNRWAPLHSVISDRWKYIQTTRPELYDLTNDPGEQTNLADSDRDQVEEMRNALDDLEAAFVPASAQNLRLSEKDLANLRALGYVAGGNSTSAVTESNDAEVLPDIKDMLGLLSKFDKARHLSMEGKLEESIALLKEIVVATSEFPAAGLLLGECLAQAGRLDEAVTTYRSVLAARPDFVGANFSLGRILASQGQFEQAVAEFRAFIKQDPSSATVHFELAQALAALQRFQEAIPEYRE
ncbi:MAG TPA: sulfatase-like hydrolase/transferase, partial [Planctomycetaceae bacterium]|nr:sulfatase-like hydrolase/transferase [Planctomycetaceae bacterium]